MKHLRKIKSSGLKKIQLIVNYMIYSVLKNKIDLRNFCLSDNFGK